MTIDDLIMERSGSYGDELPPGAELCAGQYVIERYLNSGGFGVTYLARDSLGRSVVIKECFPSAMCCRTGQTVRLRSSNSEDEFGAILELFEKEARALAALQHPYIVGVHQFFRDNGTAYMAMDFVDGKTLLDIIENDPDRLSAEDVNQLLQKILDALSYIHGHDILHRDISPDNIIIDHDNVPVLIDFGAARESATRVSRVLSKVLTVKDGYSPQEFYLAGSDQLYSSDLYALAATFYHVVSRKAPPSSHSRLAATARKKVDPLEPLGPTAGYDAHFIDAINLCLSVFPKDRLQSAASWRDMIDHDRRQQLLLQEADKDEELESMVARLVEEFEREQAERERRAQEALEAQAQITEEDRARMEAEAQAQAEAEARAREEAAAAAQAEAEEVQALIAAERAAAAARQAAIEAEEARQFHEALKKAPEHDPEAEDAPELSVARIEPAEVEDTRPETVATSEPGTMTDLLEEMVDSLDRSGAAHPLGIETKRSPSVLPRRVQARALASSDAASSRPPRAAANGSTEPKGAERASLVRRAFFGGRIALPIGGKGSKI
jgi:serine/threonine protein kinase